MGQRTYYSQWLFITSLDDKSAMIAMRFQLVYHHLRDCVAALQRITHPLGALRSPIAHHRSRKDKGHATVLPNAQSGQRRSLVVHYMSRMIRRTADDGNPRR